MIGLSMGINLVGGSATGWSPAALGASLLGWWDAERSDKLSLSGSAVTSWTDLVGGYVASQAISASKPIYSATSFNNRPGLTFDGLDDELTLASVPFPTGAAACEIWKAIDQTALAADTTTRNLFSFGGGTGATARRLRRDVLGGVNRALMATGDGATAIGPNNANVDFSGRHVVRGIVGAPTVEIHVDGVTGGTSNVVSATGAVRTRIGASDATTPGGFMQGVVSAVLVTAPLTAPEAASLYAYLNARKA